ncbi:MAG: carboxypeptidase-like regulatory domain-containing protein [Isosphaeraceae bacterium]
MKTLRLSAAFLAMGLGFVGCAANDEDRVAIVPVSGVVTLDGKPLAGAVVSFLPNAANSKPQTDGGDVTGPDGKFEAKYRLRSGLAPGKYTVTVAEPASTAAAAKQGLPSEVSASPYMAGLGAPPDAKAAAGKNVPASWPYGNASTSPLTQEIPAAGVKDLKLELKSGGK